MLQSTNKVTFQLWPLGFKTNVFPGASIYEMPEEDYVEIKGIGGVITESYDQHQITGAIDYLGNVGEAGYRNLTFITLGITGISPALIKTATAKGINVYQIAALAEVNSSGKLTGKIAFSPPALLNDTRNRGIAILAPLLIPMTSFVPFPSKTP